MSRRPTERDIPNVVVLVRIWTFHGPSSLDELLREHSPNFEVKYQILLQNGLLFTNFLICNFEAQGEFLLGEEPQETFLDNASDEF